MTKKPGYLDKVMREFVDKFQTNIGYVGNTVYPEKMTFDKSENIKQFIRQKIVEAVKEYDDKLFGKDIFRGGYIEISTSIRQETLKHFGIEED